MSGTTARPRSGGSASAWVARTCAWRIRRSTGSGTSIERRCRLGASAARRGRCRRGVPPGTVLAANQPEGGPAAGSSGSESPEACLPRCRSSATGSMTPKSGFDFQPSLPHMTGANQCLWAVVRTGQSFQVAVRVARLLTSRGARSADIFVASDTCAGINRDVSRNDDEMSRFGDTNVTDGPGGQTRVRVPSSPPTPRCSGRPHVSGGP